jgi:hypothetical protein
MGIEISFQTTRKCLLGTKFLSTQMDKHTLYLIGFKNLNISASNKLIKESVQKIFNTEKGPDGGILPIGKSQRCDVCVNGMVLNYAAYFGMNEEHLCSVVDFLLNEKMKDGGFNCRSNSTGAIHSSLHTTLSVLEGILECQRNGYTYRLKELLEAQQDAHEFILMHKLFRSDKTGEIINPNFLKLYYPCRWYYDVLKALDYFQYARIEYDDRMDDAFEFLQKRKTKEGIWKLPSKHPGQTHFEMEPAGKPSRWNTLRALRVLKHFNIPDV